jgi:hypothetical protein
VWGRGEQQAQILNLMRSAWKVNDSGAGRKAFGTLARFLERDYESAARSLRLKLPPSLYKCLATANLIESPQSGGAKVPSSVSVVA